MSSPHRTILRAPTAADLYRGGCHLLQLFADLSEHNMTGLRLELKDDRPDVVLYSAHGIPVDGWGWQTMDVVGAMMFLNKALFVSRIDVLRLANDLRRSALWSEKLFWLGCQRSID